MVDERTRKDFIRDCTREYYKENKEILIDASVTKVISSIYTIYNLTFFGNKVLFTQRTKEKLEEYSTRETYTKQQEIMAKNSRFLLEAINRDERGSYNIIAARGKNNFHEIRKLLKNKPECIVYLSDDSLKEKLELEGFSSRIRFLEKGVLELNPHNKKNLKLETIGAIRFDENGDMYIQKKGNNVIKVFDVNGNENKKEPKKVRIRDYILIRSEKEDRYSFILYEMISYHTRHHALKIIWTDLKKGEQSNKYIDRLPYKFREMIYRNI